MWVDALVVMLLLPIGAAQMHQPRSYWRFEEAAEWGEDSGGGHHTLIAGANATTKMFSVESGNKPVVGSYLHFDTSTVSGQDRLASLSASAGAWNCTSIDHGCDGVTLEVLVRPGRYFNLAGDTSIITSHGAGSAFAFAAVLMRHGFGLHAGTNPAFPVAVLDGEDLVVPLKGVGVASPSYLHDGNWHHIAFRKRYIGPSPSAPAPPSSAKKTDLLASQQAASALCEVDIFVDGQHPPGFNSSTITTTCTPFFSGENITFLPSAFDGDVDEVALWEEPLSDAMIYAHFQDALTHHQPYSFNDPGGSIPAPAPAVGVLDLKDFAPGTQLPTPAGVPTQGVTVSCVDQLKAFPSPRFPAAPKPRKLGPLSNCMDPQYMAGENQPNTTKFGVINGSIDNQRELATNWGYAIFFGNVEQLALVRGAAELNLTMKLANSMPTTPFEVSIIRDNVYNISSPRGPHNKPAIVSQQLPNSCYLQDANGTYIDYNGVPVANATKHRYLRITSDASQAQVCPDELFDSDGRYFQQAFKWLQHNLTVPAIRIWEDGEIFASQMEAKQGLEQDPVVMADYLKCNLPNSSIGYDWRTYASNWRRRITVRFRDAFMLDPELAPLFGSGQSAAEYSEFEVEGTTAYFGRWPILRDIMTARTRHTATSSTSSLSVSSAPITKAISSGNPKHRRETSQPAPTPQTPTSPPTPSPPTPTPTTMRYAKVDMYVTRPEEWDIGAGSWHGLDWLSMVIPSQIAAGDTLYSPFVSAGWSAAEEHNVRPAQYLGLLKCAAATGAEYFYAGVFSPADSGLFSRSQNWAWAAAVPAYAQAVTQLWADLLDDGNLLEGDMPMPSVMWNIPSDITAPISYRFWSGSQSLPVYIRQGIADPTTLLVVGTVQPQDSVRDNVQSVVNGTIQLPPPAKQGRLTTFEFRRQGSTYMIKIDPVSGNVASMVQLDRWHEALHPWWWSRDVMVEAELHDGFRPYASFSNGDRNTAGVHDGRRDGRDGDGDGDDGADGKIQTEFVHEQHSREGEPGASNVNLASFTSFVTLPARPVTAPKASFTYTVQPRCLQTRSKAGTVESSDGDVAAHESAHDILLLVRSRTVATSGSRSNIRGNPNKTMACATVQVGGFRGEACVPLSTHFQWVKVNFNGKVYMQRDTPTTIRILRGKDNNNNSNGFENDGILFEETVVDVDALHVRCI